jgi:A/G-specific adenine glycosylase
LNSKAKDTAGIWSQFGPRLTGEHGARCQVLFSSPVVDQLRQSLLDWYAMYGRTLPWRQTCDPYAIWVSEIMLQQTQVKTVIPYYERWLTQFPTIAVLAAAEQHQVLKAWQGLGYYARARNLHQAAQQIMQQGGQFPTSLEAALSLPGIGRTTAGGILSAAFNLPTPILDGNVKRVLARLIALNTPTASPQQSARLQPSAHGSGRNPLHS